MEVKIGDLNNGDLWTCYSTEAEMLLYALRECTPCVLNIDDKVCMGYISLKTKVCVIFDSADYEVCEPLSERDKGIKEKKGKIATPIRIIRIYNMFTRNDGMIVMTGQGEFGLHAYVIQVGRCSTICWDCFKPEFDELFKENGLDREIPKGSCVYGDFKFLKNFSAEFCDEKAMKEALHIEEDEL